MSASVTVQPDSGIAILRFEGEPTLEELNEALDRIYADRGYRYFALWDFRNCSASHIGRREVLEFADRVHAIRPDVPTGRAAALVDSDLSYGICRMAQAYLDELPVDVRVFRDADEAMAWIEQGSRNRGD